MDRGLLGPRFGRPGRRAAQLGIAGGVGNRAVRVIRGALASHGPLTRREVMEQLASHGIDPSGQAPIHVLARAALEGIICVVPSPDGEERYVLLDDWIPPSSRRGGDLTEARDRDAAAAELAHRYAAAFGPASLQDFDAWSGLGAADARRAWATIAHTLEDVEPPVAMASVLRVRVRGLRSAARRPAPVRLVGAFDSILLGYRDRGLHIPLDRTRDVNAGGGLIKPVAVAEGLVIAAWRRRQVGPTLEVAVTGFGSMTAPDRAALRREALDVGRFLGVPAHLVLE